MLISRETMVLPTQGACCGDERGEAASAERLVFGVSPGTIQPGTNPEGGQVGQEHTPLWSVEAGLY